MSISSNTAAPANNRNFAHLLRGLITALILSVVLIAVSALLMLFLPFNDSYLRPAAIAVSVICTLIGGRAAAAKNGRAWLSGGIVGLAYFLILFILSLIFLAGTPLSPMVFVMLAAGFVCGAIGGIIGGNSRHRRRR